MHDIKSENSGKKISDHKCFFPVGYDQLNTYRAYDDILVI